MYFLAHLLLASLSTRSISQCQQVFCILINFRKMNQPTKIIIIDQSSPIPNYLLSMITELLKSLVVTSQRVDLSAKRLACLNRESSPGVSSYPSISKSIRSKQAAGFYKGKTTWISSCHSIKLYTLFCRVLFWRVQFQASC